ncbi:MAG TPA: hypothetical protein VM031_00135 [Phycisphaerae bacterium]|nr:hypothetical protein [Phycisphaerae bacterium]
MMGRKKGGTPQGMSAELALSYETGTAALLLREGLRCLQRCSMTAAEYHLPLLLLSLGFERLMKVVLCLHEKRSAGKWPDQKRLRAWGHRVTDALEEVKKAMASQEYAAAAFADSELTSALSDRDAKALLDVLADFANEGRYFHLDTVAGKPNGHWVESKWMDIARDTACRGNPTAGGTSGEGFYCLPLTRSVVIVLERLARALCRALVGIAEQLGLAGHRWHVAAFHDLQELGNTDYGGS